MAGKAGGSLAIDGRGDDCGGSGESGEGGGGEPALPVRLPRPPERERDVVATGRVAGQSVNGVAQAAGRSPQ